MRFCPLEPSFSGISSTKSPFLCSFTKLDVGVGALSRRQRNRRTCAAYTTANATAAAPAEPLQLRSRYTCGAVVSAQPLCQLPSPVAAYRRCRRCCRCYRHCTCGAASPAQPLCQLPLLAVAPAQPILPQPTPVAPDGACGLGYHSGLGGGVEDVVD